MILIAGGGVGGLTLALMLQQRGLACTVLEAVTEVRELGVGINTLPHGIAELAALGLLPALDAAAIRTRELRYLNHLGQTLWSEPRGLHAGHPMPQFSIHRGRLHGILWRAAAERLPPGALRCGLRLAGFEQDGEGVTARFAGPDGTGTTLRGSALIGADGIHSALRALLHPADGGIRWQGIQMWRGAVDWPVFETGDVMLIAGDRKAKLVFYPIGPGSTPDHRLTNWVIYARTATGALFAAAGFMAAVTDVDRIVPAVSELTADGPGRDAILALLDADPTAVTGTGTRYQVAGYLFTGYTSELAQVTIAIGTTGGYVAVPLALQWADGTWLVLVPPTGDITAQAQGVGSLAGFTPWAGA